MEDVFDLPASYKGRETNFPAKLVVFGYSHRTLVWVNEQEIYFEPDEEKNYRAIVNPDQPGTGKPPDVELLGAIAREIERVVR